MEDLIERLNKIDDSYHDFILGISEYAKKKPERLEKVMEYLNQNPDANASEIVYFVSTQPDFNEDNALMSVC